MNLPAFNPFPFALLRQPFAAAILAGLAGWSGASTAHAAIVIETFTSRAAFDARLGNVIVVNFDDIATTGDTPTAFSADRYRTSHGIDIAGGSGSQFVSRTFEFPIDFTPSSAPNSYAPGPVGGTQNTTDVSFFTAGVADLTAGFGLNFLDVDFSGTSSGVTIFSLANNVLAAGFVPLAGNGSVQFLGFVTVESTTNQPVPAIARAQFTNGGGWPSTNTLDGVSVDDIAFARPGSVPEPATAIPLLSGIAVLLTARRRG